MNAARSASGILINDSRLQSLTQRRTSWLSRGVNVTYHSADEKLTRVFVKSLE